MSTQQQQEQAVAGDWRTQLRGAFRSGRALLESLGLPGSETGAEQDFPVLVPRGFAARMEYGNPRDPLLLQVLASQHEQDQVPGFVTDPNGEAMVTARGAGVLQKYEGRALLIAAGGCAVNCRYCFRRHFPYDEHRLSRDDLDALIQALAGDPALNEVILSGGDPLLLDDSAIAQLVEALGHNGSVKRLRVHTRLPIVIPHRVTGSLVAALGGASVASLVVVHCNHAREIDAAVVAALRALRDAGVTLLNQAVLLAGVNDSVKAQVELAEALFEAGVLPYYLHLLDPVAGAAHFSVPEEEARRIVGGAAERLPGYLVPRLAREVPGAGAKVILAPRYSHES